jgi:hypothetical protein
VGQRPLVHYVRYLPLLLIRRTILSEFKVEAYHGLEGLQLRKVLGSHTGFRRQGAPDFFTWCLVRLLKYKRRVHVALVEYDKIRCLISNGSVVYPYWWQLELMGA